MRRPHGTTAACQSGSPKLAKEGLRDGHNYEMPRSLSVFSNRRALTSGPSVTLNIPEIKPAI